MSAFDCGTPLAIARCKICAGRATLFDVVDFGKSCAAPNVYPRGLQGIPVYYHRCEECGFIFTEQFDRFGDEEWREKVYNLEYRDVDPEYEEIRPRRNAHFIELLLRGRRNTTIGFDFGGGNGRTSHLLQQHGWCFDCADPFGATTLRPDRLQKYNVATAFEVFEHLIDPVAALAAIVGKMSASAPLIVIGTGTSDGKLDDTSRLSWWYAAPRNGHVSLYSKRSLSVLAQRFEFGCHSLSGGFHFLTRGPMPRGLWTRFAIAALAIRTEEVALRTLHRNPARARDTPPARI